MSGDGTVSVRERKGNKMEYRKYNPVDFHNHVSGRKGKLDRQDAISRLKAAEILGIEKICISRPLTGDSPVPDEFCACNDIIMDAMKLSERFIGFCFVNPGYARESIKEMERCIVRHKMAGVKLYHQYFICDPALYPVMEYAAELGIPVLMHAGKLSDSSIQPRLSNAQHFLKAVKMFPKTTIVQGHIGGGGDWEWNLRVLEAIKPEARFYIDTSGSVIDAGIVKRTAETLGADRVLFATDGSMEEGLGKVLDAGLSGRQLKKIFSGNFNSILSARRCK